MVVLLPSQHQVLLLGEVVRGWVWGWDWCQSWDWRWLLGELRGEGKGIEGFSQASA